MSSFLLAIVFSGLVCSPAFSAGEDALAANETLSAGQTLISQNRDFELGFFSPASTKHGFLGIWYKKTPDVVVWVANKNNPITDLQGVMLRVTRNGAYVISRDGSITWYSNFLTVASNPILQLLDTGNLVLADTTREPYTSEQNNIWQSFDYPGDTRLPGMFMVHSLDARLEKFLTSWRSTDDPSPGDFTFIERQVKRCVQVGLLCIQKLAEDRPTMASVVFMLGCDEAAVSEPKEPGFFTERSSNDIENNKANREESVRETLTITELEGR